MIIGRVNAHYQAVVPLTVSDYDGQELHDFQAIIDTGLDYDLAMPRAVIARLGYPIAGTQPMTMGNEQQYDFETAILAILWDGIPLGARTLATEAEFLIGAHLLAGCHLNALIIPGGRVTIVRIAPR